MNIWIKFLQFHTKIKTFLILCLNTNGIVLIVLKRFFNLIWLYQWFVAILLDFKINQEKNVILPLPVTLKIFCNKNMFNSILGKDILNMWGQLNSISFWMSTFKYTYHIWKPWVNDFVQSKGFKRLTFCKTKESLKILLQITMASLLVYKRW